MKKLITLIFICVSSFSFSQNNAIFDENFNTNDNEWPETHNKYYQLKVHAGLYNIQQFRNQGEISVLQPIYINQNKDFSIKSQLTQLYEKKSQMGIIWGAAGQKNYFAFEIGPKNNYRIIERKNESDYTVLFKGKSKHINTNEKTNLLWIKKHGNELQFFVNEHQLVSIPFIPFKGKMLGFTTTNKTNIQIDYLKIFQDVTINIIENSDDVSDSENLGPTINSEYNEIFPVISPDGKTLYVCRDSHPSNTKNSRQDIWYANRSENNTWDTLQNIGFPLNNEMNNAVISVVSADGNTLLVKNTYSNNGSDKNIGLSITKRTSNGWSIPEAVKIINFYNHSLYVGYSLTLDQNYLIISAERDDTNGGEDLYVSFKTDSQYTEPINLGPIVNTSEDDFTPFIAADNTTLYYATEGKDGYGNADIFVTKRLDETWTNWSEPKNLGPKINSSNWDAYYTIPASGEYAYMVSSNNSIGKTDILKLKLPQTAKPNPVALIYGKVLNAKTNEPIEAEIIYSIMSSDSVIGIAKSDSCNGDYKIILPYNNQYSFMASKKGFFSISDNINISKIEEYIEFERNLYLAPIEKNDIIRLNNVFFDYDSSVLKEDSFFELDRLVKVLTENPNMIIEIGGHTDCDGSDIYNQKLSQNRVDAIVNYLAIRGISIERLSGVGYGESIPIVENINDTNKALNRRVEFKIIEK